MGKGRQRLLWGILFPCSRKHVCLILKRADQTGARSEIVSSDQQASGHLDGYIPIHMAASDVAYNNDKRANEKIANAELLTPLDRPVFQSSSLAPLGHLHPLSLLLPVDNSASAFEHVVQGALFVIPS